MNDVDDIADGWTHTLATLREANEQVTFKPATTDKEVAR